MKKDTNNTESASKPPARIQIRRLMDRPLPPVPIAVDFDMGRDWDRMAFPPERSGKTTLGLRLAKRAQEEGETIAFVDSEHAMDPEVARDLGVEVEPTPIIVLDSEEP